MLSKPFSCELSNNTDHNSFEKEATELENYVQALITMILKTIINLQNLETMKRATFDLSVKMHTIDFKG